MERIYDEITASIKVQIKILNNFLLKTW